MRRHLATFFERLFRAVRAALSAWAGPPEPPGDSEFIPMLPSESRFTAGSKILVRVTCPYCDVVHWHLYRAENRAEKRRRPRHEAGPSNAPIYKAPCGWGYYRIEE